MCTVSLNTGSLLKALVLVPLWLVGGCGGATRNGMVVPPSDVPADASAGETLPSTAKRSLLPPSLDLSLSTDKRTYRRGETVVFTSTLTNRGNEAAALYLAIVKAPLNVEVRRVGRKRHQGKPGKVVWNPLEDPSFGQPPPQDGPLTLEPGRYIELRLVWKQKDLRGSQVKSGTYQAINWIFRPIIDNHVVSDKRSQSALSAKVEFVIE